MSETETNWMSKLRKAGPCPTCGGEMLTVATNGEGVTIDAVCPTCFHDEHKADAKADAQTWMFVAQRNQARSYLKAYSTYANSAARSYTLDGFETGTDEQRKAKQQALAVGTAIMNGDTVHSFFMGAAGRGKTHLAHGLLLAIMAASGYMKQCIFLDWREYLDRQQDAFDGDAEAKRWARDAKKRIKTADVIVLDDFGSERPTPWTRQQGDDFWRYREDKTVIVTTNCDTQTLAGRYDDRTASRYTKHAKGFGFVFKGADHRKEG
ncbi:P-loop NTPase family protein [Lacticaseibacillus daqingensis]|uniref:ATP-binding protein n=1 Tax=Lacticaseibacillus daqingensis TaxID=2486014 RepID=UPI000F78F2F3|nr:ATP-binding protein [Lacticaseibacillus daqingensis]